MITKTISQNRKITYTRKLNNKKQNIRMNVKKYPFYNKQTNNY